MERGVSEVAGRSPGHLLPHCGLCVPSNAAITGTPTTRISKFDLPVIFVYMYICTSTDTIFVFFSLLTFL